MECLEDRVVLAYNLTQTLLPDQNGPQETGRFGFAIAAGTNYHVVGSPYDDVGGLADVGVVRVYNAATGALVRSLANPSPADSDLFGYSVAVSGNLVVVGAPLDNNGGVDSGQAYVFNAATGALVVTLNNPTPVAGDRFGTSVSLSGTTAVVGAPFDDTTVSDAGQAYLFNTTTGARIANLANPSPGGGDNFGIAVAISGSVAVVGAWEDDTGAANSGQAYTFNAATGALQFTLANPSPASGDHFGQSVAISGGVIVTGAPADDAGATDSGQAYLWNATTGALAATLANPSSESGDNFGLKVAASSSAVAVSAAQDDTTGGDSGSVYTFTPSGEVIATIANPSPNSGDNFGISLALTGDTLVVGAHQDDTEVPDGGRVYALHAATGAVLQALANASTAISDFFGYATAVSDSRIVVGAPMDDTGGYNSGQAYLYNKNTGGLVAVLPNPSPAAGDQFGLSAAVADGVAAIGSVGDDVTVSDEGRVFLFDAANGALLRTLTNPAPDVNDGFGYSVAVAGNLVAVGAYLDDTGATNGGCAYVFNLATGELVATLLNPSPSDNDNFGTSVSISNDLVVVGAPQDDAGATDSGRAYVFQATTGALVSTLANPSPGSGDRFGQAVSISGAVIAAGAYRDDTSALDRGSAYLFNAATGALTFALDTASSLQSYFGYSVSVSGDLVVVGASQESHNYSFSGRAYVYHTGTGTLIGVLDNPTPLASDGFGYSATISGTTVVVAALRDDTQNTDQGAVYIYSPGTTVSSVRGDVSLNDAVGRDDQITLRRVVVDGTDYLRFNDPIRPLRAFDDALQRDPHTVDVPWSSFTDSFTINGGLGNDSLTVDFSGGDPIPAVNLIFNGGEAAAGDQLNFSGGNPSTVTFGYTSATAGTVVVEGLGTVTYTGTAAVAALGPQQDVVINLPTAFSVVKLADDGVGGNGRSQVTTSSGTFAPTTIANPAGSLAINRGHAADKLTIEAIPDLNSSLTLGTAANPIQTLTTLAPVTLAPDKTLTAHISGLIDVRENVTTSGGAVTLSAGEGITLGAILATHGGAVNLSADRDGDGSGRLTLKDATPAGWGPAAQFNSPVGVNYERFGASLAMSADGTTAIVGAPGDMVGTNARQGSVYVYLRTGDVWTLQQRLVASSGAEDDGFGEAVAVSADGNLLLVGAPHDDVGSIENQGTATYFTRTAGVWTQRQQLTAAGGAADDAFGWSVSLSADGASAIVGAPSDNVGTISNQGTATFFTRTGQTWTQRQQLTGLDGAVDDSYGEAVAISGDGATLLVGAYIDDVGEGLAGFQVGSAYVYTRSGNSWNLQRHFTDVDRGFFGDEVALSYDGSTALISAPYASLGVYKYEGAATLLTRSNGDWTMQQRLTLLHPLTTNEHFGASVALSADASTVFVGADYDRINLNGGQGSEYVYRRSGGNWALDGQVILEYGAPADYFGQATALSHDGLTAIVSAPNDDVGASPDQGTVYIVTPQPSRPAAAIVAGEGMVSVQAADVDLRGSISAGGVVRFSSEQSGRRINLGGGATDALELSDDELDRIASSEVQIGSGTSGPISVNMPLTPGVNATATGYDVTLVAGSSTNPLRGLTVEESVELGPGKSLSATVSGEIVIRGALTTSSAPLTLSAETGVALHHALTTFGGDLHLIADSDGDGVGGLFVSEPLEQGWYQRQRLDYPNLTHSIGFGGSVAISQDGSTAIVVALEGGEGRVGSATAYTRNGNAWLRQQEFFAVDAHSLDNFGDAVALSGDGNTAVIGARWDRIGEYDDAQGSVLFFTRSGGVWRQTQTFFMADGARDDEFGQALAISADGNTAVVGAWRDDVGANVDQGSVTILVRDGETWVQQQRLTAANGTTGDQFGYSVAISAAGDTVVVGDGRDDVGANVDQGTATIFVRVNGVWTQQTQLVAADGAAGDRFGSDVSISGDGNTVIVASPNDDIGATVDQGSAGVYTRVGEDWIFRQQLTRPAGTKDDWFGYETSISTDGLTAIFGTSGDGARERALVFNRQGETWTLRQELVNSGNQYQDYFGSALAIDGDGDTVLVGAPAYEFYFQNDTGVAYTFTLSPTIGGSIAADGGSLVIEAADIEIQGAVAGGVVSLASRRAGRPIRLGTNADGAVGLTDAELDFVTAEVLLLGDAASGPLTLEAPMTRPTATAIQLFGESIAFVGGSLDTTGGDVSLDSVTGVSVKTTGVDIAAHNGTVVFGLGDALMLEIHGPPTGALADQLRVVGLVDLTGASLVVGGTYQPIAGDSWRIVDNDGSDAVRGTFSDLPEGTFVLVNGVATRISYVGGDGNDVVLGLPTMRVVSESETSQGVRFVLSDPVAVAELSLYGSSGLDAADVRFTNHAGQSIPGSLIVDSTGTQLTFVATAGVLPPDDYTLTLRSGATGFRTATAALLDGNGDGVTGDDFVMSFTVTPPSVAVVTVSLPHFARGPEQEVNVPATGPGLPIQVSDGGNLTALDFELTFDAGLLNITGITPIAGGTATLTTLPSGRSQVALTFNPPLASGPQTVAYLTANVPRSAASRYGERGVLDLSNLSLNGGAIPAIDRDAVHVNAYFGDAGRNGRYDSFDVQQASRMAVRLDTGFQQHPLLDPTILADFNGNGRIDSFDVQQLSRLALRLPVTGVAALPSPLPTTTDTDRLTEEEPTKSEPEKPAFAPIAPRSDIDGNGAVDAQDVAWAVYYFNRSENGVVSADAQGKKLDLNGDQLFDSADVLLAVTDLNAQSASAKGEGPAATTTDGESDEDLDSLTYLLANDLVASRKKK